MIEYGEPIKRDRTEVQVFVKTNGIHNDYMLMNENQLYELIDKSKIGDELYIILYDGYVLYDITSFISIITSNMYKITLKEKIRSVIQDWKSKQYKQE